jgi:hypothetical protein
VSVISLPCPEAIGQAVYQQAATSTERKRERGYVAGFDCPCCSNCVHVARNTTQRLCGPGGFRVGLNGWCPNWSADREWRERHPHVPTMIQGAIRHG